MHVEIHIDAGFAAVVQVHLGVLEKPASASPSERNGRCVTVLVLLFHVLYLV